MSSCSIRKELTAYLLRCNHYEAMGERIREKIAANSYFQMQTVFERMDKFKKGHLVPDDLAEFMLDNQLYPAEAQLYLIFRDFDQQRAGVVTIQQLVHQLLPKENPQLFKKAAARKYYKGGVRLEIDLEYIISKYFEHKIRQFKELTILRMEMMRKQPEMVQQAFTLLDRPKEGVLSSLAGLDQFLRGNGKAVSSDELSRMFRVLSFDRGAHVTFQSFSEHLDPFGKGHYIGYSQRMAEKHLGQQDFLRRKVQLKYDMADSGREQAMLVNSIADMHECNGRLIGIIQRQGMQRRLYQQQLLAYRARGHLM